MINHRVRGVVGVLLTMIAASSSGLNYPFNDDFEAGLDNWITSGTWGLTTGRSVSPTHAAADSPGRTA